MAMFTTETERVFLLAISEATRLGHTQVEPEHLLLGLARVKGDISRELFNIGLPLERLRLLVGQSHPTIPDDLPTYSDETRLLATFASAMAKGKTITPKTLLQAIIQQTHSKAYEIIKATGELDKLEIWLSE